MSITVINAGNCSDRQRVRIAGVLTSLWVNNFKSFRLTLSHDAPDSLYTRLPQKSPEVSRGRSGGYLARHWHILLQYRQDCRSSVRHSHRRRTWWASIESQVYFLSEVDRGLRRFSARQVKAIQVGQFCRSTRLVPSHTEWTEREKSPPHT